MDDIQEMISSQGVRQNINLAKDKAKQRAKFPVWSSPKPASGHGSGDWNVKEEVHKGAYLQDLQVKIWG